MSTEAQTAPTGTIDPLLERRMSLLEHIGELRTRLLRSLVWVALSGCGAYLFSARLYAILLLPLQTAAPGTQLHYFSPTEPFLVTFRIAMTAGIIIAAPLILLELWGFIAPALTARERRAVTPILPIVLGLFAAGAAFVYYVLLPVSLSFLMGLAQPGISDMLSQQQYFGLVTALCLTGGLLFEMPAVLSLLGALGLVSPAWLWRNTGYAVLVLMLLAAIITPTGDAFNMLVLTAPLLLLYLLSIGVVWLVRRGRSAAV